MSSAGFENSTPRSPEDGVEVDRLETELYSVVELLEDTIKSHEILRTEILPQQHSKFDEFCEELKTSLHQMIVAMESNPNVVPKGLPYENSTFGNNGTNTFDRIVDGESSKNSSPTSKKNVTLYENSILAQINQFVNWHELWHANLIEDMLSHSKETSRKLQSLAEEAARVNGLIAASQCDDSISQQTYYPFSSPIDQDESGASEHHRRLREQKPSVCRIDERVEFIDRFYSNAFQSHPNRVPITSASTIQTDIGAEPEVLCLPVASVCPVSAEELRASKISNASASIKLQHIFSILQRKREEQSLSTVANAQQVRSLRAAASRDIDELWQSIETNRVEALPFGLLRVFMRNMVHLSMVEEKELFYEHALFCALQLRNPAKVNELAVVSRTDANARVAPPMINWSFYKSSRCEYLVLLSSEEKNFFEEVTKLKSRTLVIWCSAYACLLLRLADRGVGYVRRRLSQLNQHLADAYSLDESLPRVPFDSPIFLERLRRLSDYTVDPVRKNTLYKGLIERYEHSVVPQRTKKLLNFLLLTSLRYRGMNLITLVDECRKLYAISTDKLVRITSADETTSSWQTYTRYMNTFVRGSFDKRYKYCQVFRPQMYSDLHFNANFHLCSLLCLLIDVRKLKSGCGPSTVLYHKTLKRQAPRLDATWKRQCVKIVKKFKND